MSDQVLALEGVTRSFHQGRDALKVLDGADLVLNAGEIIALVGPSGAGKSTLLQIAGLLEFPDGGEVRICGEACARLSDDRRTAIRRERLGFVYQYHHLLPEFSALENIVLPQMIAGVDRKKAAVRGRDLLERLGLAPRADHRPGQLSGGEQQRVAIARALANGPSLLLADEPTGNLDPHTAEVVFDELLRLVKGAGLAAVIATHNPELARRMDRMVSLRDGHLQDGPVG
jgi:lipoprotein-releasing system ATP-binding protein